MFLLLFVIAGVSSVATTSPPLFLTTVVPTSPPVTFVPPTPLPRTTPPPPASCPQLPPALGVIFADDFSTSLDLTGRWVTVGDSANYVASECMLQVSSSPVADFANVQGLIANHISGQFYSPQWQDYEVTADVFVASEISEMEQGVIFLLRHSGGSAQDSKAYKIMVYKKSIIGILSDPQAPGGFSTFPFNISSSSFFEADQWFQVKLRAVTNRLEVFVNDALVFNHTDCSKGVLLQGRPGVQIPSSKIKLRNFRVRALPPLASSDCLIDSLEVSPVEAGNVYPNPANGHYYQVVAYNSNNFGCSIASALAERQGGYLATITSESEQAFINSIPDARLGSYQGGAYLGLFNSEPDWSWKWVTGESLGSYQNFCSSGDAETSTLGRLPACQAISWNGGGGCWELAWTLFFPGTRYQKIIIEWDSSAQVKAVLLSTTTTSTTVLLSTPTTTISTTQSRAPISTSSPPAGGPSSPYVSSNAVAAIASGTVIGGLILIGGVLYLVFSSGQL